VKEQEIRQLSREYVQNIENVADVEIKNITNSSAKKSHIYVIEGIARKHTMNTHWCDAVTAERSFKLWIFAKDGKIKEYRPNIWIEKGDDNQPPPPLVFAIPPNKPIFPMDSVAEALKDNAKRKVNEKKEKLYEEMTKTERYKRGVFF
jgi:hypothetical protein